MIAELQEEKHRLDEAIEALERLTGTMTSRRRGRPARSSDMELSDGTDGEEMVDVEPLRSRKAAGDRS